MKLLDDVEVLNDNYNEYGIKKGMVGTIIESCIRDESFYVIFPARDVHHDDDIFIDVKIEDLKLVKDNHCSDRIILDDLPKNNPKWWCKVEDGYIMNLLGEKKNKIPYQYNS